jgi:inorganic pyrophosphatase
MDLTTIPTFARDDVFHVIVETPRGSGLKLKYESKWEAMSISRPLPLGVVYPYDWGFVPSTSGPDGDPLDAMVLWDVPAYPGVVLECRAVGVLQVEQNRENHHPSQRIRNDRIMAIPVEARRERTMETVQNLPERVRQELQQFAIAATALEGKDVRIVGWGDADAAVRLVRETMKHGVR